MATFRITRKRRPAAPGYRPQVEALENRFVPSTAYIATDLVADRPGIGRLTDPNLVNAWGVSLNPTGAFWVSANETGVSVLYTGDVNGSPVDIFDLVVAIPGGLPTGQVFNPTTDFVVHSGTSSGAAAFIFVTEAGQVTGWNPGVPPPPLSTTAQPAASIADARFTGVALANNGAGNFLYVADFFHGTVEVFDKDFNNVDLDGSFTDPKLPAGFSPFNIASIGGKLYVSYATHDEEGEEQGGPGLGLVDVFDTNGHFLQRLVSRGPLNAPWGMVQAPADFGQFSGALLVGNFGNGRINAFDPDTGEFLGRLATAPGQPVEIDGLWGLTFGTGVAAGDTDTLYYTAGPGDEEHGLFGKITANPAGTNPVEARLDGSRLVVDGSRGDDQILVQIVAGGRRVRVLAGGESVGKFDLTLIGSVEFHGFAGRDMIKIDPNLTVRSILDGGAGPDMLRGGGGNDLLLGGLGQDNLAGFAGHDVIIGGAAADVLRGMEGDDLLVAGTTTFDGNPAELTQIQDAWTAPDSYRDRVDRLRAGTGVPKLDATTVLDDGAHDVLTGATGLDWFFASLTDTLTDRIGGEELN